MAMTPPEPDEEFAARQRTNLLVAAVAIGLIVVTVLLMLWLKHENDIQDCIAARHLNCAPIDTDQTR
jgi:hypothetical protein